MRSEAFIEKVAKDLFDQGLGRHATNYKLRDWLFSRQRFWGEPFPILHELDESGEPTVSLDHLSHTNFRCHFLSLMISNQEIHLIHHYHGPVMIGYMLNEMAKSIVERNKYNASMGWLVLVLFEIS